MIWRYDVDASICGPSVEGEGVQGGMLDGGGRSEGSLSLFGSRFGKRTWEGEEDEDEEVEDEAVAVRIVCVDGEAE